MSVIVNGVRNRIREFFCHVENGSGKPSNTLDGLKRHWKADLKAGFQVSWIAVAFALGISKLSGAPDVAGITTAIVAGLFMVFIGGSYVTITGPAAALAPFIMGAVTILGGGMEGYKLVLVAICLAGAVQIVLALLGAAKFSWAFPVSVVEGMLAGIGVTILGKEMPHVLGEDFHAHTFGEYVSETYHHVVTGNFDPHTVIIAGVCLALLFVLTWAHNRHQKALERNPGAGGSFALFFIFPPIAIVLAVGVVMGRTFGLTPKELVHIPENLWEGFVFPNFAGCFAHWQEIFTIALTLVCVDGVESLATAEAVDKKDPYHRKSNPHRVLLAMGLFNLIGPLFGALTNIPGGLKSTANVHAGGRTLWANFFTTVFVIILVVLMQDLVNMVPYATLASILIFVGYQLFRLKVWMKLWNIGREQVAVAGVTAVVTVGVDILWGLGAGLAVKTGILCWHAFFRNPISRNERIGNAQHIGLNWIIVSFNSHYLREALAAIPDDVTEVHIHTGTSALLIDHTSSALLNELADEWHESGRGQIVIHRDDEMESRSAHPSAFSVRRLTPPSSNGKPASQPVSHT